MKNLPYYIEQIDDTNYNIWTKVTIPANSSTVIYLKKELGYNPNGNEVFEFYDDFDGNSLDTNKWTSSGSITVSDGILTVGDESYVYADFNLPQKLIVEAMITNTSRSNYAGLGIFSNYDNVKPHIGGNGYGFCCYVNSTPKWSYESANSSDSTHALSFGYKEPLNMTLKYDGNTAYWISDLGEWNQTLNIDITNCKLKIASGDHPGSSYIKVDYIFVRKYADQEPTVSVEQVDSNTWKITISNPNDYDLTDFQVKIPGTGIVSSKTDSLLIKRITATYSSKINNIFIEDGYVILNNLSKRKIQDIYVLQFNKTRERFNICQFSNTIIFTMDDTIYIKNIEVDALDNNTMKLIVNNNKEISIYVNGKYITKLYNYDDNIKIGNRIKVDLECISLLH